MNKDERLCVLHMHFIIVNQFPKHFIKHCLSIGHFHRRIVYTLETLEFLQYYLSLNFALQVCPFRNRRVGTRMLCR